MDDRKTETRLAYAILAFLVIYVPVETWVSLPHGLWHPMYLVDFIAMVLMGWGAVHSLRARPHGAPGILCAGLAWASASGFRATGWRWLHVVDGRELEHGAVELWAVTVATVGGLICLALSLALVVRSSRA